MDEEQDLVIPLVKERVSATKREAETGRVRVRTRFEERQEIVRADLARESVEIQRVPMNVERSAMPPVRQEGGITIVPVVEEVLVVEKKLMLVEKVHLRRTRSIEEHTQPVQNRPLIRSCVTSLDRMETSCTNLSSAAREGVDQALVIWLRP